MTKFVTLVSGKGGTGKTTTAINLTAAIHNLGKTSVLIDGNLQTPHISLYLGMQNIKTTLNDFFKKKMAVGDIISQHHSGIRFIAASLSYGELERLHTDNLSKLFQQLDGTADVVIVDSAAGMGKDVLSTLQHSGEAFIVTNPTRAAVMDALKMMKRAHDGDATVAGVILNRSVGDRYELSLKDIEKILPLAGVIPEDDAIRKAHHAGTPVVHFSPRSKSSKAYSALAQFIVGENTNKTGQKW